MLPCYFPSAPDDVQAASELKNSCKESRRHIWKDIVEDVLLFHLLGRSPGSQVTHSLDAHRAAYGRPLGEVVTECFEKVMGEYVTRLLTNEEERTVIDIAHISSQ